MLRRVVIPLLISCLAIAFVVVLSGGAGSIGSLVDIPSLLIALVVPFILALVTHGHTVAVRSFSRPLDSNCEQTELRAYRAFFTCFLRYTAAFTVFAVVTGTIMLLGNLADGDTGMIGRNLGIALLSLFYGSVGVILFILPFLSVIDRKLAA
jgi:flagellar motor component MotA